MKTKKCLMLLLTAFLVPACVLPVWADNEITEETISDETVTITGKYRPGGSEDQDGLDISTYEENEVGILANAGSGTYTIEKGYIDTFYGGVLMTTGTNGSITLYTGGISAGNTADESSENTADESTETSAEGETADNSSSAAGGGFGMTADLNGGTITANSGAIDASGSFGLNVWAENNGTAEFKITGDGESDGGIFAAADGVSVTASKSTVTVDADSINAGASGADLSALGGGKIALISDEISGDENGVLIESFGSGSTVTVNSYDIDAETLGLDIAADTGAAVEVTTNDGSIIADTVVDIENMGGTVTVDTGEGELAGVNGLSILSNAGTTTVSSGAIAVENYAVLINALSPEAGEASADSGGSADAGSSGSPATITVNVNGDILNEIRGEAEEGGIEDPDDPGDPEPDDIEPAAKDAEPDGNEPETQWDENINWVDDNNGWTEDTDPVEDDWDVDPDWEEDDPTETSVDAAGVIINADAEGSTVEVTVKGVINMIYGNDVYAGNKSKVTLNVEDNVETDYGNRINATGGSTVNASFGKDIAAGGLAVDTFAGDGTVKVDVKGDINAMDGDESDPEAAGIHADSDGKGNTAITVGKGITVKSTEKNNAAYGIDAENTGGTMDITVAQNVNVTGVTAVGLQITNDADSSEYEEWEAESDEGSVSHSPKDAEGANAETGDIKTTVIINGNVVVSGSEEAYGADILDTGNLTLTVGSRDDGKDPDKDDPVAGITAKGSSSTGMSVITDGGNTNIEVYGDVKGTAKGLEIEDLAESAEKSKLDILVSETISGGKQSLTVSEKLTADQLDLTVWEIVTGKNKNAALTPDGNVNEAIENSIKYIIKVDPKSKDKLTVLDENLSELPTSHGYPVMTAGKRIYVQTEEKAVYNGKSPRRQSALQKDENGNFYLDIPIGGAVWLSVYKNPEPSNAPNSIDFYTIGDLFWLFDRQLPGTGFSASRVMELREKPQGMIYGTTGLTLQIPELGVAEAIMTVPEVDGEYPVEWLGSAVGLLEQSSLPGKGVSVLTGHNHLNNTEAGPFLSLGSLESGARVMVTDARNGMQMYRVYGNYKIAADGFASVAEKVRENALVLITCEDESVDGGYLNRRVILAEPVGGK